MKRFNIKCTGAVSMSYKRSIILLASFSLLASCGTNPSSSESIAPSSEIKGQYDLRGKLNQLKTAKTLQLTLQYDLKDGTNNRGSVYTYTYTPNYYAISKDGQTAGISNGEDGIWSFQIADNEFIAGPITNIDLKSIWEENAIRNYYDGLNAARVGESDTHVYALSDSVNLGTILRMAGLAPSTGLFSIIQEAKVEANENGVVFSIDFGVNGTIVETVTHIDDASYSLPQYEDYIAKGGKPRQAEKGLIDLMALFSSYNYSSPMGSVKDGDKLIEVGTRYFAPKYIYEDYTDDYLSYVLKSSGKELKRRGYIEIENNENVQNGIYSFEVNHYDASNKPELKDSDLTQTIANAKLVDRYPYYQSLTYSKYLSSFYSGYKEPFKGEDAYYSNRSDLATEFANSIFGDKTSATGMYIVGSLESDNPSVTFYVSYSNGQGYEVSATDFTKTNIEFLESYLSK